MISHGRVLCRWLPSSMLASSPGSAAASSGHFLHPFLDKGFLPRRLLKSILISLGRMRVGCLVVMQAREYNMGESIGESNGPLMSRHWADARLTRRPAIRRFFALHLPRHCPRERRYCEKKANRILPLDMDMAGVPAPRPTCDRKAQVQNEEEGIPKSSLRKGRSARPMKFKCPCLDLDAGNLFLSRSD